MKFRGLSGAVLAGGSSKRMGNDKRFVGFFNETLLGATLKLIKETVDDPMVSCRPDDEFCFPGIRSVKDGAGNHGPLMGIHQCLKSAKYPWVLVIPCDMPLLNSKLLNSIVKRKDDGHMVISAFALEKVQPLVALYHKKCLPHLKDYLFYQGKRSVVGFLDYLPKGSVSLCKNLPSLPFLFNINTPKDIMTLLTNP